MDSISYVKDIDIFGEFDEKDFSKFSSFKICKSLKQGELVSEPGKCENRVFLVEEGQIKLYKLSEDGREQTIGLLSKGNIFGDLSLKLLNSSDCNFASSEKDGTTVCILDKKDFFEVLATRPKFAIKIISDLAVRLSEAEEKIANLGLSDAKVRLLSELLRLGKSFGVENDNKIVLNRRFTHEDLANLIGTTRETVTKTIKSINKSCEGCVEINKNHHFVLDKDKVLEVISPL